MMFVRLSRSLDRLLRGNANHAEEETEGRIDVPPFELAAIALILAALSGVGIGSYALVRKLFDDQGSTADALLQMVSSGLKLPALFFLTLLITVPSFYVFNAVIGSRFTLDVLARQMTGMLAVMTTVLCSLVPILVFFSFSTSSYVFIKLLGVVICGIAGLIGLWFLIKTVRGPARLVANRANPVGDTDTDDSQAPTPNALNPPPPPTSPRPRGGSMLSFYVWIIAFGLVGLQMSWMLRPFIGTPHSEFAWLRSRESNFFIDVARSIGELIGV